MTDLSKEFEAGRLAHLERGVQAACPYLATSNSADAWHAGRAYESARPTDFVAGKVTHGRGYLVNVEHDKRVLPVGRFPKLVYHVGYGQHRVNVRRHD